MTGIRVAKMKVSMALLHDLLKLPANCSVEGVEQTYSQLRRGGFAVYLSGDALPDLGVQPVDDTPGVMAEYGVVDGKTVFKGFRRLA